MQFDQPNILHDLIERTKSGTLDAVDFGVIGFDEDCAVTHYNTQEAASAGLAKDQVMGKDLFVEVAPCMNNFMVSERFDEEDTLDDTIDYVLTLKMKPTKVKLRLLKNEEHDEQFILVKW